MKKIVIAIGLAVFAISNQVSAQTFIGPSLSVFGQSLTEREIVKDVKLNPKSPGMDFGASALFELSPFTSIKTNISYSFQSYSYDLPEETKLNVQYLTTSAGPQFTFFDEGTGKIRPYGELLVGASLAVSKKSIESTDPNFSAIPVTGFNVMVSPGIGAFIKVSEFSKFYFGGRYDRFLIEQFDGTDSRLNRFAFTTSILFTL